jgi:hypothetical protein
MSSIAILTDFGTKDWFVGSMKGVISAINPSATIIDITHEISPGDIQSAAFALAASVSSYPSGTLFLTVVDPGVGTDRAACIFQTDTALYVAPDNGVVSYAISDSQIKQIVRIENRQFLPPVISTTFHGRDIFAPAAAHLSCGTPVERFGKRIVSWTHLSWPSVLTTEDTIECQIMYIDRFGNTITNCENTTVPFPDRSSVLINRQSIAIPLVSCFSDVDKGEPCAYCGSAGYIEIGVNGGNAAHRYDLSVGDCVTVKLS